CMQALEFPLSF
nr:immunoglobulin light chain junction region [Macaca mulatta]MOW52723.1 immunoglobulin light chain junction region [Macaca mulatta]MOW55525.1 immunoglobulin light chain junction region [Macaca mulatta]MOW55662.1 immunoglobulin light chain junction region [Macaca mulatta]MOX85998.1 immunoglobulin light chain junction region [Macaca mulatta]